MSFEFFSKFRFFFLFPVLLPHPFEVSFPVFLVTEVATFAPEDLLDGEEWASQPAPQVKHQALQKGPKLGPGEAEQAAESNS